MGDSLRPMLRGAALAVALALLTSCARGSPPYDPAEVAAERARLAGDVAAMPRTETPEIPPLPLAELFVAALDPAFPDPRIAQVRLLAAGGDVEGAAAAYLAYRRSLPWRHPLRDGADEAGDAALAARSETIATRLAHDGVLIPFYIGWNEAPVTPNPFDWEGLRAADAAVWSDAQRVYFWNDLGRRWRATGDAALVDIYLSSALDWVTRYRPREPVWPPETPTPYPIHWAQYPYPDASWSPIVTGIRLQDALPGSIAYFLDAPAMTPAAHARLVASVVEHARHLLQYETVRYNWQAIEAGGLATAAALYPEFAESAAWRAEAVRRARAIVAPGAAGQFLPDGWQHELSPHYHCVVARNLWLVCEWWRWSMPAAPPLADVEAALERAIDVALRFQRPDATEPMFGDSVGTLPMRAGFFADEWRDAGGLITGLARFDRPDWRTYAGDAHAPTPPLDAYFPASGYGAFRTGWGADDLFVGFDLGIPGYSHTHEDGLHVTLEEGGHRWLVDSGRGYYSDATARSQYYLNSAGHNTARPVGRSQVRQVLMTPDERIDPANVLDPLVVLDRPRWAYARGVYADGYDVWPNTLPPPGDGLPNRLTDARHTRMMFLERDTRRLWVYDLMENPEPVAWEVLWHVDAEEHQFPIVSVAPGFPQEYTQAAADPPAKPHRLWSWFLGATSGTPDTEFVEGRTEPPIQGWMHDAWAPPRPVPTAVVTTGMTTRGEMLSLFVPIDPLPPAFAIQYPLPDRVGVSRGDAFAAIAAPNWGKASVIALFNPGRGEVERGEMATDGELAVLWATSYIEGQGEVLSWAIVEGTYLTFRGVTLHRSDARTTTDGPKSSSMIVH